MTSYSELMAQLAHNDFQQLTITDDWTQGRASFGGLVACIMLKACKHAVNDEARKVRNVQVTFVGPVLANEVITVETQILRSGGSVTSLECKLIQNKQVQSTMIASFGKTRDSVHQVIPNADRPNYPAPENAKLLPYVKDMTPEFVQHVNVAWAEGDFPFTNTPDKTMGGWCQIKDGNGSVDEGDIMTMIDAWPPIAIQMLDAFAPCSTLNWTVQFIQELPELSQSEWYQYQVEAKQGAGGYSNTQAHFWSEHGELLAISTQTVAVFA